MRGAAGIIMQGTIVGALGLAGLLKFLDLPEFRSSLAGWQLIPAGVAGVLSFLVPSVEVILAGIWFVGGRRGLAVIGTATVLVGFTAAFAAHLVVVGAPDCNCFGVISRFLSQRDQARWTIARNASMLAGLALGSWLTRAERGSQAWTAASATSRGLAHQPPNAPAGFTIIETLITVALIAVVLSLILPTLAGVRQSARELISISNLRTHGQTMGAYAGDDEDRFPYLTNPEATLNVFRHAGVTASVGFFDVHLVWNFALADNYYGGDHRHRSFAAPWHDPSDVSNYFLSHTVMTRPEFWAKQTRIGPVQWTGSRLSETLFPSAKGIFVERDLVEGGAVAARSVPAGARFVCADGSARDWRHEELNLPYFPHFPNSQWPGSSYMESAIIMHTVEGVRGRDFE
jgi:prepilin-type N-terminal cleavage/methylation domain-containing protein